MNSSEASPHPRPSAVTRLFQGVALVLSAAVYVAIYKYVWRFAAYPIELEWREGTNWLHAFAQSHGVNIFENARLAYINANHGIFDPVIKAVFARLFPFLEPQYILRAFILLFPAVVLLAMFVHNRRKLPTLAALASALGLSCALLIFVHDIGYWNSCIGRSDATGFTLLALAYLCYATPVLTRSAGLLRHVSYLSIALVLSTNWRMYPAALAIPAILEQGHATLRIRELVRIYLLIAGYTLGTCAFFVAGWFHSEPSMYYRYFFGFFSAKSPLAPATAPWQLMIHYVRTPAIACLLALSVAPLLLEAGRALVQRTGNWPRILAALAVLLSLLVSLAAFKINFMAAGYWYLCPPAIITAAYYNTRYKIGPGQALMVLALSLGVLWRSDNLPSIKQQYEALGATLPDARKYTDEVVRLDRAFGVYSEEAHLFKRSGTIPPIDMGDAAEIFANANYLGPRFTAVFAAQKSRIIAHEPVLVFIGGCASTAVKQLAENEEYYLLLKSPAPQIGGGVYVRVDHLEEVQHFLAGHSANSP